MNIETWMKWYKLILDDFGFLRKDDEKSADILNKMIKDKKEVVLDELGKKKQAIVFGAGPSLNKHIGLLNNTEKYDLENFLLISADGATTALIENNIIPDIIVTDLDGNMGDIFKSYKKGSKLIVHAHGNNTEAIEEYVPEISELIGTTQSLPFGKLKNFGGFTDGDRCVFIAVELGFKEILLAGMDFGDKVTQYSRPNIKKSVEYADEVKKKKLEYAQSLIKWIETNEDVTITNLVNK